MPNGSRFEVDDPRFESREEQMSETPPSAGEYLPEAPVRRRSWLATCFFGCLITFVVLLVLAGIAAYWFFQNWRELMSSFGATALKESIEATDLPEQEKAEISVQVDRLATAFREKRISERQVMAIMEQIVKSPLMTTLAGSAIERKYVAGSGLTDREKAEGGQTLRRFLRGSIDGKIDKQGMDAAMQHVADRDKQGNWQLRDRVTDEDLRSFFQAAKTAADNGDVAVEPEDIDPSDEFKRIIDEAMDGPAAQVEPNP